MPESIKERYTNASWRSQYNHWKVSQEYFGADILPLPPTDIGPGSLALYLGSEPGFSERTVWFEPSTMASLEHPEDLAPLRFSTENHWWKITQEFLSASQKLANGNYLVGCPDLVENIDILASLRGDQTLLMDLYDRPEWVHEKLSEINQAWFEAYDKIYDIIKLPDGSSAFWAFQLWGPEKTAKVQCDASAMLSPEMFREFVVPHLREQCEWLDNSLYHLDGHQSLCHLDALFEIEALDAIEWTPDPKVPSGGSPEWYGLYRRILAAGKSVQAFLYADELIPLLDAVGGKGMYLAVSFESEGQVEKLAEKVEQYR